MLPPCQTPLDTPCQLPPQFSPLTFLTGSSATDSSYCRLRRSCQKENCITVKTRVPWQPLLQSNRAWWIETSCASPSPPHLHQQLRTQPPLALPFQLNRVVVVPGQVRKETASIFQHHRSVTDTTHRQKPFLTSFGGKGCELIEARLFVK